MGAYKYLRTINNKKQSDVMRYLLRMRAWEYRHQNAIVRLTKPTYVVKARKLGYKSKPGYSVFRVRVRKGRRKRRIGKTTNCGKPKHSGTWVHQNVNKMNTAEGRLGRKCPNLRILNSYWSNQDAKFIWFEIVCVDPFLTAIREDPRINWICDDVHKHREMRGLTSAGKKHRGLRSKFNPRQRPSTRGDWKRRNTRRYKRRR